MVRDSFFLLTSSSFFSSFSMFIQPKILISHKEPRHLQGFH